MTNISLLRFIAKPAVGPPGIEQGFVCFGLIKEKSPVLVNTAVVRYGYIYLDC